MKQKQLFLCMLTSLVLLKLHAGEGRFTVQVVDESGGVISGAVVKGQFKLAGVPGAGWGDYKLNNVEGITDVEGKCVITGKGDDSTASAGIFKDGFYVNTCRIAFTNSQLGRWQPWNPTVKVVLQKVGIQVPMYAKRVWEAQIPAQGRPIGFDLTTGDWVAPDGKGKVADLLFTFVQKTNGAVQIPHYPKEHQLFDNTLTVSLPGDGDGIQSAVGNSGGLRLPREAQTNGYNSTLIKREYETVTNSASGSMNEVRVIRHSDFNRDANYFFRVRSKLDANGNITNAFYGKIYGDFNANFRDSRIGFTYYLNSEPNSRNMEFNSQQNLFTNLPPLERVSAP